jgi:hypothetical protein
VSKRRNDGRAGLRTRTSAGTRMRAGGGGHEEVVAEKGHDRRFKTGCTISPSQCKGLIMDSSYN